MFTTQKQTQLRLLINKRPGDWEDVEELKGKVGRMVKVNYCRGITRVLHCTKSSARACLSNNRYSKLDTRISFVRLFVRPSRSGDPPLDSETGWTGKLWSNRVLLILEN